MLLHKVNWQLSEIAALKLLFTACVMNTVCSAVNYSLSGETYILEIVFVKMKKSVSANWKVGDMLVVFMPAVGV